MSTFTTSRGRNFLRSLPGTSKAAIIGGTIGGLYAIALLVLLRVLIVRRRRKRFNAEDGKEEIRQSNTHIGFNDYFVDPPLPKTPRRSEQENRNPPSLFLDRRTFPEETDEGGRQGNPFWMFDSAYGESELGSPHRQLQSRSTSSEAGRSSWYRPYTAVHMPTDVFVSQMNAQFPEAVVESSKAVEVPLSFFRSQTKQVGSSSERRPQEIVDLSLSQGKPLLPPIPIHPLIHKDSMDKIVSRIMERPVVSKKRSQERIRIGHTKVRKRKSQKNAHSAQSQSLSVLSERMFKRLGGGPRGVSEAGPEGKLAATH